VFHLRMLSSSAMFPLSSSSFSIGSAPLTYWNQTHRQEDYQDYGQASKPFQFNSHWNANKIIKTLYTVKLYVGAWASWFSIPTEDYVPRPFGYFNSKVVKKLRESTSLQHLILN
jgi:hypothetical protein